MVQAKFEIKTFDSKSQFYYETQKSVNPTLDETWVFYACLKVQIPEVNTVFQMQFNFSKSIIEKIV